MLRSLALTTLLTLCFGCGLEEVIFPIWEEPSLLDEPPAELGPYAFAETRIELEDLGDGRPGGLTVFAPVEAEGPRPTLVWVLGVNNRAHFHQSFHEYMASWGYIDIVPDTRDISFLDTEYHARNTANANRAFALARDGTLALPVDVERMALGGYSVGGPLAAFAAAREPQARALALWAPAPAFVWQGVEPAVELPRVTQPSLFLLAEFDNVAGDWPNEMRGLMAASAQTVEVIPEGVHLFFQQPPSVDDRNPATTITRPVQMRIALETTRAYLDEMLNVAR